MNTKRVKNKSRSEAATRGWATRRKNKAIKQSFPKPEVGQETAPEALNNNSPFIKKSHPEGNLNQIYSTGLEYAFVNAEGEQCHPFALCKDYLQDAIWSNLNKKPVAVHGFSYSLEKNPPLDLGKTRLAIRFTKKSGFKDLCEQSVKFLNEFEAEFGASPTKLLFGGQSKGEDIYVFEGDKIWMYAPPMISMYTLLIRVGLNYDGSGWKKQLEKTELLGSNDRSYLTAARPAILKLCGKNIKEIFSAAQEKNYPEDCPVFSMHHYSGIQCLGNGSINQAVSKHWQQKTI